MLSNTFFSRLISLLLAILLTNTAFAAESGDIILGQSAPLTGSFSELGAAYRDGAQLYFDKINQAGGINGRKIRLVTLDDAYDAKRAKANTEELIEKQKALALFGYMFTNTVFASLPVATRASVPFVAPYAGNDELYTEPANPVVFMTRASYATELDTLLRHIQAMGLKRVALARYDSLGGAALQKDLEAKMKAINLEPIGVATMKLNSLHPEEAVAKLEKLRPQAIVLGVSGGDAVAFVRQFRHASNNLPVQFLARSLIGGHQLVADLGAEGRGIVISQAAPSPSNGKTRISREYQSALKTVKFDVKARSSYIGLEGYIAAKVMVEGLRRAGTAVSRQTLTAALETMHDWDMGDFTMNYSANSHSGSKFVTVTVIGAGGHFIE
jgi:branched-chain amino acid transport system substrate-binding protein